MDYLSAIILAAGQGTRLNANSERNKVAYKLGPKPMIAHTVEHLYQAGITSIYVVVGFASASVKSALGNQVTYVNQAKRLGTGHAVRLGLKKIPSQTQLIITMYGDDSAFYPPALFQALVKSHQAHHAAVSVLTLQVKNPNGLGRIIRVNGEMVAITEEKNATPAEKRIREINTGLFCFDRSYLDTVLPQIHKNPVSGEYYLTDVVTLTVKAGIKINALLWPDSSVWHGVNTLEEWQAADALFSQNPSKISPVMR
jgi:bifunctional UDP-N-acetylglucosamine pyrophosphorylase / glucosamine-1-phosphate N-acetyltransferase